ncbi:MAG TPA: YcgL domain-containing protein [Thiolapillus brandeum]|uniref:YcgL domain-containing protein ENG92_06295 n=1 Tax=Thiolapillus brandeum TaxID=1076588 RepID=A0A831KCZ4_9GAMM|nr:YcgL domain-containing protein [Thiolapillus brandeum]
MTQTCWVYKSSNKDEMYLYLAKEDDFETVPEVLMARFGKPSLVMELKLHEKRSLARADVDQVMQQLTEEGYYLQMPPQLRPDIYHGNEA